MKSWPLFFMVKRFRFCVRDLWGFVMVAHSFGEAGSGQEQRGYCKANEWMWLKTRSRAVIDLKDCVKYVISETSKLWSIRGDFDDGLFVNFDWIEICAARWIVQIVHDSWLVRFVILYTSECTGLDRPITIHIVKQHDMILDIMKILWSWPTRRRAVMV